MSFDPAAFAARVVSVLPKTRPMPLHDPWLGNREIAQVSNCIDDGWVSGNGPYVERFERMLAKRLGVPFVIATNTGTAALHVALLCAGVKPGDEVMIPALTFIATANAARYCGAVPYFVDSGFNQMTAPPALSPAAMVRVHFLGHPAILDAADYHAVPVIEDAAEALGSTGEYRAAAALTDIGTLSFNGNKIITTGQGGAVVTPDREIAKRVRHLVNVAKVPNGSSFWHDESGFNYRMPDLNAALGIAQLERLDEILAKKRALAMRYKDVFADFPYAEFVDEPPGCRSNFWLSAFLLPDRSARDATVAELKTASIEARTWTLVSDMPPYRDCPGGDLRVARDLAARLVCLPSGAGAVSP